MSFRLKTILGIALIEIVLLSILVFSSMRFLQDSNEAQLVERAQTSAQLFATMAADTVVSMDLATLDEMVAKTITTPGIRYLRVRHAQGMVLSEQGEAVSLSKPFEADTTIADAQTDQTFDVSAVIEVEGVVFGTIELGQDTGSLEVLFAESALHMLSVAALEIIIVGVFGVLLGGVLTRRLKSLQRGAKKVANGEWGHTISVRGRDELADTALSFNEMSESLAKYAAELEQAKVRAEEKRAQAETFLASALESLTQGVMILDEEDRVVLMNKAFADLYDITDVQMSEFKTGKRVAEIVETKLDSDVHQDKQTNLDIPVSKLTSGRFVMQSSREISAGGRVLVDTDITPIMESEEKNRQLQLELLQSQKMESIGRLAGGVAHEINTPIQFVGTNITFISEAATAILDVLDSYETLAEKAAAFPELLSDVQHSKSVAEDADLDFVREELSEAVKEAQEGVDQVTTIVASMKEFSNPSTKTKAEISLNRIIERTTAISQNEWNGTATLTLSLDPDLPMVIGVESDLNQVLLNMIVNAAQAIKDMKKPDGQIKIVTSCNDSFVWFEIHDNGPGIPKEIRDKVFDPFFTTKEVGKGTGQGLAITHDILVNKHDADIAVRNNETGGATFTVSFPR